MTEIRCVKCKRLLMKAESIDAEIKCPKCGYVNKILKIDGGLFPVYFDGNDYIRITKE